MKAENDKGFRDRVECHYFDSKFGRIVVILHLELRSFSDIH